MAENICLSIEKYHSVLLLRVVAILLNRIADMLPVFG